MAAALLTLLCASLVQGLRFDPAFVDYNLNQNELATNPLDYNASRPNFKYHESPDNWRFPFYTLFLDKLANGAPPDSPLRLHTKMEPRRA
jgi:alpha-1,3-glucan synthase